MDRILLTTDSCSDLPEEIRKELNISILPFGVIFPDHAVLDDHEAVAELYDYYERTKKLPTTSAPNPYEYTEFFDGIAEKNPGCQIIHVGYSSECSCAFQNATLGASECKKAKVKLVDSKNVSGGLGNIVLKAAELLKENPSDTVEQLAEKITYYARKTHASFVPENLDYLLAGGRVSNAAAISAMLLKLKPRIDILDGKLVATKKYRGNMLKIVSKLVDDFVAGIDFDKSKAYIFYTEGVLDSVINEMKRCLTEHGFQKIKISLLGCVMTVHGGKGAIGISATER